MNHKYTTCEHCNRPSWDNHATDCPVRRPFKHLTDAQIQEHATVLMDRIRKARAIVAEYDAKIERATARRNALVEWRNQVVITEQELREEAGRLLKEKDGRTGPFTFVDVDTMRGGR